jgi:hypothetical protein
MSEIVISEFFVNPSFDLIDEIKPLYSNYKWYKALCRNKSAFPFLKNKIKKWLPIHFKFISSHCQDIDFLRKNKDKINYEELSKNPCVHYLYDLLEEHIDELNWSELSKNPNAVPFLKKHKKYIDWWYASQNTSLEMIDFLEENIKFIKWSPLSANPNAIKILQKYTNMVDIYMLNINPNAIELLKKKELIDLKSLCNNHSKEAMEIIESNINNPLISFEILSTNPYATDILIKNPEKIDWFMAIENENIGELFKAFPEKIDSLLKCVVKYPSVIPYIKDIYNISPVKLAENPSIFKLNKDDYKQRLYYIQKMLEKIN